MPASAAGALVALLALAGAATGGVARAQTAPSDLRAVEKRVTTLEGQMRAVQRQVFPGGDPRFFAAEAPPAPPAAPPPGTPAEAPLIDLQARIEALETQQRALTGQVEELQFRLRQFEDGQMRARADTEFRLSALEGRGAAPSASPAPTSGPGAVGPQPPSPPPGGERAQAAGRPAPRPSAAPAEPAPPPSDPEARYRAAYALYEAKDYAAAAPALEAFVRAHPTHPRASNAQYWAGRSVMAQGRYPEAAKLFLAGYQAYPRGQRAAESLLWLGKALTEMKQSKAACQALDQLRTAYPDRLTGVLATEAGKARAAASCSP